MFCPDKVHVTENINVYSVSYVKKPYSQAFYFMETHIYLFNHHSWLNTHPSSLCFLKIQEIS